MNMHLYPKLAWHGIIKNKKTYVPFLLTSIGLVMMFYIVSYLTYNKSVKQMRGGDDMQMILSWGVPVVAFFVVIFLFYMNSFLMRRRKTEFGLSNTPLLVGVTVGSYLVFAVLYAVMYKATSRSYYQLVK